MSEIMNDLDPFLLKRKEIKENPPKPVRIFYLFRHDPPVYGSEVAEEMEKHGYSGEKNYPGSSFTKEIELQPELIKNQPSEERLQIFDRRDGSKIIPKFSEGNPPEKPEEKLRKRAIYEGTITEIKDRKNLTSLVEQINNPEFEAVFLTGPRTRHLFTYNSVINALKAKGANLSEKLTPFHTDKLTDLKNHWLPLMEIAKKLELEDPWGTVKDPAFHDEMQERNIETMQEIEERMRKYLLILERWWSMKNHTNEQKNKVSPIFIGFTSDFEQRALLQLAGIKEINGKPTNYFKSAPGSYISLEITKDGVAKVFYQAPDEEKPKFLGQLENFENIIKK